MKSYIHQQFLLEIDHKTGQTKTVEFVTYPAKQDNWLFKRFQNKQKKNVNKSLVKDEIEEINTEEDLW